MKLDTDSKRVKVESSGAAQEAVLCGFDPEGTAHLMRLLSDLYKDAASSVLREYSVNAYDSHIQAGNPAPIEVTLPSDINPTLIITDHGVGLSREELIEVYSRYGASTKRGTNDQVGAFGLGAKSAFTLGQQFMVTAVKNGWRTVAVFSLNTAGVGTVTILSHDQTTDPNGVSVSISVDKPGDMQRAAPMVFSTWPQGSVLVNGKQPWSVRDESLTITDKILLVERCNDRPIPPVKLVVVMGNIGYPVTYELSNKIWREWNDVVNHNNQSCVYAYVDVGDVDIAPSREAMRDTQRTLDRLKRILTEYSGGIVAMIDRELNSAPTFNASARTVKKLAAKWGIHTHFHTMSWKGHPISPNLSLPYPGVDYFGLRDNCSRHYHGYMISVSSRHLEDVLVITDVPPDRVEAAMRAVRPFMAGEPDIPRYGEYRTLIFAPPGAKAVDWFEFGKPDTYPVLPFDQYMAKARANKPKETPGRKDNVQYQTRCAAGSGWRTTAEIAALGLQVVVMQDHEDGVLGRAFLRHVIDGAVLVRLGGGRTKRSLERKLGKKHTVITLEERVTTVAKHLAKSCSKEAGCAARTPVQILRRLAGLRDRITHPAVNAVLDARSDPDSLVEAIADGIAARPGLFTGLQIGLEHQFPLLQAIIYSGRSDVLMDDHIVSYLNKAPRRRGRRG